MGNPQGSVALVFELLGTELANWVGLRTPDFALLSLDGDDFSQIDDLNIRSGSAFCSKWIDSHITLAPNSRAIAGLRNPALVSRLVVFDTWIRNLDRFNPIDANVEGGSNLDNLLIIPDRRKTDLRVIDHTHAFCEIDPDTDLDDDWINEEIVYGRFPQFSDLLDSTEVLKAIGSIQDISEIELCQLMDTVPDDWDFLEHNREKLVECLVARAGKMSDWLPTSLFGQTEMQFGFEGVE